MTNDAIARRQLFEVCSKFVLDNNIHAPEDIYQMDEISLNALELVESICDIIGYASLREIGEDNEESYD